MYEMVNTNGTEVNATTSRQILHNIKKQSPASYDKIDTGLSFETEYEDCPAEQILSRFGNHVIVQMVEVLVQPALNSDMSASTMQWAIFNVEGNAPLKFEEAYINLENRYLIPIVFWSFTVVLSAARIERNSSQN